VRAGKRLRSHAIEADGHHVLSDFYTTVGLLLALLVVRWTGWLWIDGLVAGAIGALLAWTGLKLLKKALGALIDTEDPRVVAQLLAAMEKLRTPDIIAVHALRTLRSGAFVHVDVHVVVPEFYDIARAHDLVESFGERVLSEAGHTGEAHTHVDPCRRRYCASCLVEPCPVRREVTQGQGPLLTSDPDGQTPWA
jgi:cation diffusion facilitator family transporter